MNKLSNIPLRAKLFDLENWASEESEGRFKEKLIVKTSTDNQSKCIHTDDGIYNLRWSPDGKKLAFCSRNRQSRLYGLYIYDAEKKDLSEIILKDVGFVFGSWSPDGKKIVYRQGSHISEFKIFICNYDGSDEKFLTEGYNPVWSPSGKYIAFVKPSSITLPYRSWEDRIWIIRPDGTGKKRLEGPKGQTELIWSPTDDILICGYSGLYNLNQDRYYKFDIPGDDFAWSPDGSKIIFEVPELADVQEGVLSDIDLWIMNSDGSGLHNLTYSDGIYESNPQFVSNNEIVAIVGGKLTLIKLGMK